MSPDHGNFYQQIQSQFAKDRKPATLRQIKKILNQPIEENGKPLHLGHHNNKAEASRKNVFNFLKGDSYRSWIKGIEYDPELENGDIVINLERGTPQGKFLVNLIGYETASIHVGSTPEQVDKYVKKNLNNEEKRIDWYRSKQIVIDGTSTQNEVTPDLLFQMWVLSDNLFVPGLTQEYISLFDYSTQMILQTPEYMRPVIKRRRPLIQAFYRDDCSKNVETDTRLILEQFSLT